MAPRTDHSSVSPSLGARQRRAEGSGGCSRPTGWPVWLHSHIGHSLRHQGSRSRARSCGSCPVHKEHGADALAMLDTLDLGGGFGIAYRADETPLDVPQLAAELREIVKRECHAAEVDVPRIAVEPGRAIAGPGTVTVYTVGTLKDVPLGGGHRRRYVGVDGGMSDNIRTALYDAPTTAAVVSQPLVRRKHRGFALPGCGQALRERRHRRGLLAPGRPGPGDMLAVAATGAYCTQWPAVPPAAEPRVVACGVGGPGADAQGDRRGPVPARVSDSPAGTTDR